jgi:hypothetical protein
MTPQIAPFVLVGMDALLLAGGVWVLTRAFRTWRLESRHKDKEKATVVEIRKRKQLPEQYPTIAKSA